MPIETIALMFSLGISIASGIEVGKAITSRSGAEIQQMAVVALLFSFVVTLLVALLGYICWQPVLRPFMSGNSETLLRTLYNVMLIAVVLKSLSLQLISGILRAGGDAVFCLKLDFIMQWLILLPVAWGMLYLNVSSVFIYSLVLFEEAGKTLIAWRRFRSGKWRADLTQS